MSVKLKPENLKMAARLATSVKTPKVVKSRSNPWCNLHRLSASDGNLRLLTTDGSTFLEWHIPTEGTPTVEFDVAIDAGQFNDVVPRLSDAALIDMFPRDGLLTFTQGQRTLRMQLEPSPDYPSTEWGGEVQAESTMKWRNPSRSLGKSLAFVAHFIDNNKTSDRKVATLGQDGRLRAGSPSGYARVVGLDAAPSTLNFRKETAGQVASFLLQIGEMVEITIEGNRYAFTCPEGRHRLSVRGESQSLLDLSEGLTTLEYEKFRIARKTLDLCMAFLATVVTQTGKPLEFRIRGQQDDSSLCLSTPGRVESEKSGDEIPIVRTFHKPEDAPSPEDDSSGDDVADTNLKVNSESLREILSKLEGEVLNFKYFSKVTVHGRISG